MKDYFIVDVLEAAHVFPYLCAATSSVINGLSLRADVDTLLDLYLLSVDPEKLLIRQAYAAGYRIQRPRWNETGSINGTASACRWKADALASGSVRMVSPLNSPPPNLASGSPRKVWGSSPAPEAPPVGISPHQDQA